MNTIAFYNSGGIEKSVSCNQIFVYFSDCISIKSIVQCKYETGCLRDLPEGQAGRSFYLAWSAGAGWAGSPLLPSISHGLCPSAILNMNVDAYYERLDLRLQELSVPKKRLKSPLQIHIENCCCP
jgi:hypothetical protein